MRQPLVSVIIPAYKGADYLGEAIQSVLQQTYANFEIVVVNDASPDHTPEVVAAFSDPRLKYIVHERNCGLPATRNSGVRASAGEYIALLDQDDIFHPDKLQRHVEYLEAHPEVGLAYNSRFEIIYSSKRIRGIWVAPKSLSFADLILAYPFSPSDIVIRREWLFTLGLFDESNTFDGEDLNTNCRLTMAGCRFAIVDQVLNYRRNYPARMRKGLAASLDDVFRNMDAIFADPRCPADARGLRDVAYASKYMVWAYWALAQDETEFGQSCIRKAIQLDPTLLQGEPSGLMSFLVHYAVEDERGDLEKLVRRVFDQLPVEVESTRRRVDWACGRACLQKGISAVMWEQLDEGGELFDRAVALGAEIDASLVQIVTYSLSAYKSTFGSQATQEVIRRLAPYLNRIGGGRTARRLAGSFALNQAFENFAAGEFQRVPSEVMSAVANDPTYLANRGVLSIFLRSIAGQFGQQS